MPTHFDNATLGAGLSALLLTVVSGGAQGGRAVALLEDIKDLEVFRYALPLTLFASGACLYAMRRPIQQWNSSLTERFANSVLGLYSGLASVLSGWLIGLAGLSVWHASTSWLVAAIVTTSGLVIFLSPWFLLSEALTGIAEFRRQIFVPAWRRSVARWGGLVSMICGIINLVLTVRA